ncbi:MAG: aminopeptidase P family protein [Lachnospiraceae bacterium]|nr:aminopeptidase P family protein [Lachnospiraceae bacterium]
MENIEIKSRLKALREEMQKAGMDFYLIPTADFHNSEYVGDYFKVREFFSGFTGSNGTLLIWQEGAGLWTDGRYFVQAEKELEGTGIELFRMAEEGVPDIPEFLESHMQKGQTLGFDGRVVTAKEGEKLAKILSSKEITLACEKDLAQAVWEERPALSCKSLQLLELSLAGMEVKEKLRLIRDALKKEKASALLFTKLDELMWLLNVRGGDIECNPVALSYGYLSEEKMYFFVQEAALDKSAQGFFQSQGIEVLPYETIGGFLGQEIKDDIVLLDSSQCSYSLYKKVQASARGIVEGISPAEALKAVKNPVELENMKKVYLQDSVVLTKFIYWLKKNIGKEKMTELSVAEYLDNLRSKIPGFLELSFPTISAYGENAAMMHYEATPENYKELKAEGLLLVDSGGQYLGGTTDVTRTVVLGPVSEEIKRQYTAVVAGMLRLSRARFLYGCSGRNLDILARAPLWDMGIDYKCGTGHGIGYILNVHEGPQSIRWRFAQGAREAVLEEGMIVSDEPGVYMAGSHGIRIENILAVKRDIKNESGQFMHFEQLTYVPIDLEAIDASYMTKEDRLALNEYHSQVYEKISPFLDEEEKEWLKEVTRWI